MFIKNEKYKLLNKSIDKLIEILERKNIHELMYILGNKKEIIKRNILAGVFRGVGIGIGVTIVTALLVYILRRIITLNIPIIGEFIVDIVEIVEKSR